MKRSEKYVDVEKNRRTDNIKAESLLATGYGGKWREKKTIGKGKTR